MYHFAKLSPKSGNIVGVYVLMKCFNLVGKIQSQAFNTSHVKTVKLGYLKSIESGAFIGANLKTIEIVHCPVIASNAFESAPNIEKVLYCGHSLKSVGDGPIKLPVNTIVIVTNMEITAFGAIELTRDAGSRWHICISGIWTTIDCPVFKALLEREACSDVGLLRMKCIEHTFLWR